MQTTIKIKFHPVGGSSVVCHIDSVLLTGIVIPQMQIFGYYSMNDLNSIKK